METYKPALFFLLRYLGLYIVLNTIYAFYVDYHRPQADPLTVEVSQQTAFFLRLFGDQVTASPSPANINVPLIRNGNAIVEVYEGCNSINVMIVYFCFLIAFRGPWKAVLKFALAGIAIIYALNLLRVAGLYWIALYYPDQLYFFHKFFFTGMLYAVVFIIWFFWVKTVGAWNAGPKQ